MQVDCSSAFLRVINPTFETIELPMHFVVANVFDVYHESILSLEGRSRNVSALNPDSSKNKFKFDFQEIQILIRIKKIFY